VGNYKWNKSDATERSITVTPKKGTTVYTVADSNGCLKDTFEVTAR
jgi:hypothetical protein